MDVLPYQSRAPRPSLFTRDRILGGTGLIGYAAIIAPPTTTMMRNLGAIDSRLLSVAIGIMLVAYGVHITGVGIALKQSIRTMRFPSALLVIAFVIDVILLPFMIQLTPVGRW